MTISLNSSYSTTRRVVTTPPSGLRYLPAVPGRRAEGGLRKNGYFKATAPGKPLITAITVVLNRAGLLENCIASVLFQSYDNVEYIVVDGGSTDGTVDLLMRHDDLIDYWVSEPDDGLYHAMNKAAEIATGDWLCFINSDDTLVDCLQDIAGTLQRNDTVYYGDSWMNRRKILYDGHFSLYKMAICCINHQAVFFPKLVFERYRYDQKYTLYADYVLLCRCVSDRDLRFEYLGRQIAVYNETTGITSQMIDHLFQQKRLSIIRENFPYHLYLLLRLRIAMIGLLSILGIKIAVKKFMNRILHTRYDTSY